MIEKFKAKLFLTNEEREDLLDLVDHFEQAVVECLANDQPGSSFTFTGVPALGDGFWFLVREVSAAGNGTYDTGAPSQAASRDNGIDRSPGGCP